MNFNYYDLGYLEKGRVVEVTLNGNAANVRLMDSSNYNNYKNGRSHKYLGGLITKSPVRLSIPNSGNWYVTVDLQGLRGQTKSAVRVLSGPLPEIRQPSLNSVPSLVRNFGLEADIEAGNKKYDVFISHASEDKDEIVRPLAIALRSENLEVWYDEFEMRIGDSLRRKIDIGLANSKFGIVILSREFVKKGWTNYELDGIITKSITGEQVVLPIWHNITKEEVIKYSPSLADKLARNTAMYTVEEIASEIAEVIKGA